jgi:DNA-binding MarR family transcriptional regulator
VPELERNDVGFLLAVAGRRWNEVLERHFAAAGYPDVRASYGALLVPLLDEDGLRMGELARRARLSKQTVTTMARLLERDGLVERRPDEADARATRVFLSARGRSFRTAARRVLRDLDAEAEATLGKAPVRQLRRSLAALADLGRESGAPARRQGSKR